MKSIKEKLAYLISGGLLVAVGVTLSPVTAQKDKFGEIECTKLTVVDANGKARVKLDEFGVKCIEGLGFLLVDADGNLLGQMSRGGQGGYVGVYGKDGESHVLIGIEPGGGLVQVTSNGGESQTRLGFSGYGGHVKIYSDKARIPTVSLMTDEHGGRVKAYDKKGLFGVELDIDEHGGSVTASGKNGQSMLSIGEHGGRVDVRGKGDGKAAMGVNEYGNGAVSTFDKNGYRQ